MKPRQNQSSQTAGTRDNFETRFFRIGTLDPETLLKEMCHMGKLETMYQESKGFDRRVVLRQYYMEAMPEIMNLAKQHPSIWAKVYPFNWQFNKNEKSLWASIRFRPMVMYPEFPVLNRFVDFGNPHFKIAIEADSKEFHSKKDDIKRDLELLNIGWKTFRVSYKENFTAFTPPGDIALMIREGDFDEAYDELEKWLLETSDGVVDAIYFFFFMSDEDRAQRVERFPAYFQLAKDTLAKHRLIDFELPDIKSPFLPGRRY